MIDLLIVSYNTQDKLERALTTLNSDYAPGAWKLYIADNGSTDGSVEWLKQHSHLYNIENIWFNENIGYAGAINQMAAQTDSEYLAALNADAWMNTKNVLQIEQSFVDNPDQAIMGPKQRDEKGNITGCPIVWTSPTQLKHDGWQVNDPNDYLYRYRVEVPTVSGAALFTRRSVWEFLTACPIFQKACPKCPGAFLDTPMFYEETYYSRHAEGHGFKVIFDGRISIGHTWRASTGDNPILSKYWAVSKELYRKACDDHGLRREDLP